MQTLLALGKVAALICSPLLLALYVFDRSGGNASSWFGSSKSAREVVRPQAATPEETASPAKPLLLSGSKSFSGATVIDAGTLTVQPAPPPVTMLPGPKSAPAWAVTPPESRPVYTAEQLHQILEQPALNGPGVPQQAKPR